MTTTCDFEGNSINLSKIIRNYEGMIPEYLIVNEDSFLLADKLFRASKSANFVFSYKCKITDCVFIQYENMKQCLKIIKYCTNENINTIRIQLEDNLIWIKNTDEYDFKIVFEGK